MELIELWKIVEGGGDIAVIAMVYFLWKIDRRLLWLENEVEHQKVRIDVLHNERTHTTELLHGLGVPPKK